MSVPTASAPPPLRQRIAMQLLLPIAFAALVMLAVAAALAAAAAHAGHASALGARTPREQGFIAGVAALYRDHASTPNAQRLKAYSDTLARLYRDLPSNFWRFARPSQ